ncbi:hypothetical protein D3C84_819490 [compost metagenome]
MPAHRHVGAALLSLREIAHQHGDEESRAQRRGLFLADRVQSAGEVQALTGKDRAIEVQIGVDRHHCRIAVGLDHLEHFEVVFRAGAFGEFLLVQPAHAPHLQHAGRRRHIRIALGASELHIGVQRIIDAHHFAPLPDHGRIHPIPGVDTAILAPDHGLHLVYQFLISQVRLLIVLLDNAGSGIIGFRHALPAVEAARNAGRSPPPCNSRLVPLK